MELRLKSIKINHKKGFQDFTSLFFALAVIFGVAIFFIILLYAYGQVEPKLNTGLSNSAAIDPNANVTKILGGVSTTLGRINILFPLLIIGLFGFALVSALMSKSHPAFLFLGLIVLAVALILAAIYSNVYESISENSNFTSVDADLNIVGIFLDNLPIIILILFIAIGVILYLRSGGSQGI